MKSIFLTLAIAALTILGSSNVLAQTFIGGGVNVIRSSSYDPTPEKAKDGGSVFPGGYIEGGLKLPLNFQARVLAEYSGTPQLPTIFTTDEGSRKTTGEFRIRPELRYWFNPESIVRPFVAGGVDYYRQRFKEVNSEPLPIAAAKYGDSYSGAPYSGMNPFLTFGVGVGSSHEGSFTRLFGDSTDLNPSRLSGYRANYSYTKRVYKDFSVKAGIEADYLRFRETNGFGYIDSYYEKDTVIKAKFGFIFGGDK